MRGSSAFLFSLFGIASLSVVVGACSGTSETAGSTDVSSATHALTATAAEQTLTGTLIETIGRDSAQRTTTEYYLDSNGKWIRLITEKPIAIAPRTEVTVQGVLATDGRSVRVSSIEPAVVTKRLAPAVSSSAEPGTVAFFLIRDPSAPAEPYTKQQVEDLLFNADTSTNAYFREVSYGQYGISGDVFGWYTVDMPDCVNTHSWLEAAMTQAATDGFDTDQYRFAIGLYVRPQGNCFYANADVIGDPNAAGGIQSFVLNSNVFAHEIGHILGLSHASSLRCQGSDVNLVTYGARCDFQEYADPFDAMGFDGYFYHFNTYSKGIEGWVPAANEVRAESAGDYTIVPQEQAANGTQSLLVPIPDSNEFYHVELREQFGFDNQDRFDGAVLVRRATSSGTQLLDMTPDGNMDNAGLGVGQTFEDPFTGISIGLVSKSADSAVIHVELGGPTCSDGVLDGSETDVDCGGLCNPCINGQSCSHTRDCYSESCIAGECVSSTDHGLTGQYYEGDNFDSLVFTMVNSIIDFDWRGSSPIAVTDHFSVRWTGEITPYETGLHTFRALVDDGVRLWVNDQLIIDRWDVGVFRAEGSIELTAGQPYSIRLEYFENEGDASARLLWQTPSQPFDLVPASQLSPGGCTLATATDLGPRTTHTSIPSNGCFEITQYPSWWQYTSGELTLQTGTGTGTYPVPLTWTDTCTNASAQVTLSRSWQSIPIGYHSANCPVLLSLAGSGSPVELGWF